jgi:hypothetical protein
MKTIFSEDHVLPRPVERLPEYAPAKARQTLAEKIIEAFGLSAEAACAIANAVVDPSAVRKSIGDPTDPEVEKISVPGGTLLGIRTEVWARRIMPDPRNPRTLPKRKHPFAVEPGTGGEDAKFRPVPEPRSRDGATPETAELAVEIESRDHLTWASQQAASYILADNDWRYSIASQGVMEAVWLAASTYEHSDSAPPVTAPTSYEGSSRVTAVHDLLHIRSADVPYDDEGELRKRIKKLNEAYDHGGGTREEQIALRCERLPALILVGFRKYKEGDTAFPTAVKSLVALRHVDFPKPWGEGPENESLADEVLDELFRRNLISSAKRAYFAGSCTRAEAKAAHLSDDPAVRAASIMHLFTNEDARIAEAIRAAVTSQSTRKRIGSKMLNELATALILRATTDDPGRADLVRRCMRHAFSKPVHHEEWKSTDRNTDTIVAEALNEVRLRIADETITEPGPASLELAVRAAYPLVVSRRLTADRNFGDAQADRRTPGEVLDAMRKSIPGVYQLAQALRDFGVDGQQIRGVDEDGQIKKLSDGSGDQMVNDSYLRSQFPPPGKTRAPRPGDTPVDLYHNAINSFSQAVERLEETFTAISVVPGDDGRPLVETRGVDSRECSAWRDVVKKIDEELIFWARTFRRVYGTTPEPSARDFGQEDEADPGGRGDTYAQSYEDWDESGKDGGEQLPT